LKQRRADEAAAVATENKKQAEKQQQIQQGRMPNSFCPVKGGIVYELSPFNTRTIQKTRNENKTKIVFNAYFNENINYTF